MTNKINNLRNYIVSLPLCLTGCMGVYESGFECPPGKGVGCKSISEVNHMVDQGKDLRSGTREEETGKESPIQAPVIWFNPWSRGSMLDSSQCSEGSCKTEGLDVTNSI